MLQSMYINPVEALLVLLNLLEADAQFFGEFGLRDFNLTRLRRMRLPSSMSGFPADLGLAAPCPWHRQSSNPSLNIISVGLGSTSVPGQSRHCDGLPPLPVFPAENVDHVADSGIQLFLNGHGRLPRQLCAQPGRGSSRWIKEGMRWQPSVQKRRKPIGYASTCGAAPDRTRRRTRGKPRPRRPPRDAAARCSVRVRWRRKFSNTRN